MAVPTLDVDCGFGSKFCAVTSTCQPDVHANAGVVVVIVIWLSTCAEVDAVYAID